MPTQDEVAVGLSHPDAKEPMSGREKYWSELVDIEKIERMREIVERLERQVELQEQLIEGLMEHGHDTLTGRVSVSIHRARHNMRPLRTRRLNRSEEGDDVYF